MAQVLPGVWLRLCDHKRDDLTKKTLNIPKLNDLVVIRKVTLILPYYMNGPIFPGVTVDATRYKNSDQKNLALTWVNIL